MLCVIFLQENSETVMAQIDINTIRSYRWSIISNENESKTDNYLPVVILLHSYARIPFILNI